MGAIALPSSGDVYLDSNALIYSLETHARYWSILEPVWEAGQQGQITVVSSELAVLETLVAPLRAGDNALIQGYEQLFQSPEVRLVPISRAILREAASLRATIVPLRSPDAIHAASGRASACALFITNDRIFRQVPNLPVIILDDLVP